MTAIDLNADVGEGFPHDEALLGLVTSANIACGFHAGDVATMRRLCEQCAERGVAVGAQVSYLDREGFGRLPVEIGYADLLSHVVEQREALAAAATVAGARVDYLKPHGALYNRVVHDREQARAVVDGAGRLPVLGLPGSMLLAAATEAGLRTVREFFADRGYTAESTLQPRGAPGDLIADPSLVAQRIGRLVDDGVVVAVDGSVRPVTADSVCVHGDTDDAVRLAEAVRSALLARSIEIRRFS